MNSSFEAIRVGIGSRASRSASRSHWRTHMAVLLWGEGMIQRIDLWNGDSGFSIRTQIRGWIAEKTHLQTFATANRDRPIRFAVTFISPSVS